MIRSWWSRLRILVFGKPRAELDEELAYHIERATELRIAQGERPKEARRLALIEFGGVERTREQCEQQRPGWWLATAGQDVRYALRGFRRNPVFAATVVVTLALGIGATTAVFSVVDRILFRSLPYGDEERLVSVGLTAPINPQEFMLGGSYYHWRDEQTPFTALAAEGISDPCDLTERNPARLTCGRAEAAFLPMLGVRPVVGRNFLPEEDRTNGPKVALISFGLWRTRFNLDPGVVNRVIEIDGKPVRVVGVLPRDFEMPDLTAADLLMPLALDEAAQRKAEPGAVLFAFARLKPGVTADQAKMQLRPVFDYSLNLAPAPFRKEVHLMVRSLRDRQTAQVRLIAWVLLGAVLALLAIACANVASLFLTRGAARERELAVRAALGAGRGRLASQTLTEALLLTSAGAAAGWLLAEGLLRVFITIAPEGIPFLGKAQLDPRILLFTVLLSLVCGVLFGMIPALERPRLAALGARAGQNRRQAALRRLLVVGQIAVSVVLLSSGALLLRSFRNLELQELGMHTRGVLTARVELPQYRYGTGAREMEFFLRAEAALRRLPGVTAVGLSDTLPPGSEHHEQIFSVMQVAGQPRMAGGTGGMVSWRWATPGYFATLEIPIVRGRGFSEADRDSSGHWMILSSLLASRLFPGEDPVGQRIQPVPNGVWYTVAGVAANVKNTGLTDAAEPEYYLLRRNAAEDWDRWGGALTVETQLPPATVMPWMRAQIAELDPTVPVEIATLEDRVSRLADRPRFESALLGFFALTGLLMAVVGLYGVTAFSVAQRRKEVGVRLALGASRRDILRLMLLDGVRLIAMGSVIGLAGAWGASRMLKSLLFSVGPHDPATFAGVTVMLGLVALAATLIPARAATRVDPVVALRYE
jgi:predicted permease